MFRETNINFPVIDFDGLYLVYFEDVTAIEVEAELYCLSEYQMKFILLNTDTNERREELSGNYILLHEGRVPQV